MFRLWINWSSAFQISVSNEKLVLPYRFACAFLFCCCSCWERLELPSHMLLEFGLNGFAYHYTLALSFILSHSSLRSHLLAHSLSLFVRFEWIDTFFTLDLSSKWHISNKSLSIIWMELNQIESKCYYKRYKIK